MIKSIDVIGSQTVNNIISVCNEGRLCDWGQDIKEPVKCVDLKNDEEPLAVHSVAFPHEEINNFYIGSENSLIYSAKIHTKGVNDDNVQGTYSQHNGAIMAMDAHPQIES